MTGAVLRRVPPALRHPLPVRRLPPGVRAGVQRRRDGERGLRHLPRPLVFQSRVTRTYHVVRATRSCPRDGAHVVRRPRDAGVVGRPVAQRVLRRVHGRPGSPPTSPSSTTRGCTTPTCAASGDSRPTSGRAPTRSPATARPTRRRRSRTSTASPMPRAPASSSSSTPDSATTSSSAGASDHFEKHRFGNATMADLLDAWDRAGAGDLSGFADSWLRTAGPDRIELDRKAGVVRRTPLDGHPADRDHTLRHRHGRPRLPGPWRTESLLVDADCMAVAVPGAPSCSTRGCRDVGRHAARPRDPGVLAEAAARDRRTVSSARASGTASATPSSTRCSDPDDALTVLEAGIPAEDTDDGVDHDVGVGRSEVVPVAVDPAAALARVHDVGCGARWRRSPAGSTSGSRRSRHRSLRAPTIDALLLDGWRVASSSPTAWWSTSSCAGGSCSGSPVLGAVDRDELAARAGRRAHRGLPGRARQVARLAARRRGQGLGVAAVHRRGRRCPTTSWRPIGLWLLAARPGRPHRRLRRPLLRRAARHRARCAPGGCSWRRRSRSTRVRRSPTTPSHRARRPARPGRPRPDAAPRGESTRPTTSNVGWPS